MIYWVIYLFINIFWIWAVLVLRTSVTSASVTTVTTTNNKINKQTHNFTIKVSEREEFPTMTLFYYINAPHHNLDLRLCRQLCNDAQNLTGLATTVNVNSYTEITYSTAFTDKDSDSITSLYFPSASSSFLPAAQQGAIQTVQIQQSSPVSSLTCSSSRLPACMFTVTQTGPEAELRCNTTSLSEVFTVVWSTEAPFPTKHSSTRLYDRFVIVSMLGGKMSLTMENISFHKIFSQEKFLKVEPKVLLNKKNTTKWF